MNWNELPSGHLNGEPETVFHLYVVALGRLRERDVCCSGSGCLYSKMSSECHQSDPAASQILDSLRSWCTKTNHFYYYHFIYFCIFYHDIYLRIYWLWYSSSYVYHDDHTQLTQRQSMLQIEEDEEKLYFFSLMSHIFLCTAGTLTNIKVCIHYVQILTVIRMHRWIGSGANRYNSCPVFAAVLSGWWKPCVFVHVCCWAGQINLCRHDLPSLAA